MSRTIPKFERVPTLHERQTDILDWLRSRGCRVDYSDDTDERDDAGLRRVIREKSAIAADCPTEI